MIWLIFAILVFIALVFAGWIIAGYNHLVNGRQSIKTQWSNIKTEYQRRADLFYNLVEAVKSHKKFEKTTLIEVVKARKGNFGRSKEAEAKNMNLMDNAFSKMVGSLNVVFERYPELKSSQQHNKLMEEVRVTEDRINVARTDYNDIIRGYNIYVRSFPSNFLAKWFGYSEEKFFVNEKESDKPFKIKLKE